MLINNIFSIGEASKIWKIAPATIKHSCTGQKGLPPRFQEGECRKSGNVWLVTREGMERLYGKPQKF